MRIPTKIEKCPIKDSVVELRFETDLFEGAVFGVLYNLLRKEFSNAPLKLPLLNLPDEILYKDPQFEFHPHYVLSNEEHGYSLKIGPKVLVIVAKMPYEGWANFRPFIEKTLKLLNKGKIIKNVTRLGHRVSNVFEEKEANQFNIELKTPGLVSQNTQVRTQFEKEGFFNTLFFAEKANIQGKPAQGPLLDIDTYRHFGQENAFLKSPMKLIDKAHQTEKELFFSLLNETYLQKLKPQYHGND